MTAVIHSERRGVDRRLSQLFNSTRDQWIDIVKAAVAARARCTDDGPKSAPGYYAYAAGTTRLRQMFRREGWERGDEDGIETIVNHDLKKKVAVMNTDTGTADRNRTPVNRTLKGSATTRVVDLNNQGELFKKHEMGPYKEPPYSLWYLCIHDDKGKVRAEVSMPIEFRDGYIAKFSERIFILQDDDWEKIILEQPAEGGPTQDYEINVRRK
jgi:hypothetical protein